MKKIFKRLLSIMLALVMVVTMVPITKVETVMAMSAGDTVYFDTGNNSFFKNDNCVPYVIFKNGTETGDDVGKWTKMNLVDGTVYSATIPDGATYVQFARSADGNTKYGGTDTLSLSQGANNCFKPYSGWNTGWKNSGMWSVYSSSETTTESTFYVNADLVDYYNNNRVGKDDTETNRYSNQGNWTTQVNNNAPYSSLNKWISDLDGYASKPVDTDENGNRTIYWNNAERTGDVYIYYWGGSSGTPNGNVQMTQVDLGSSYYSAKIPADAEYCIFDSTNAINDGNNKLTGDLTLGSEDLYTYGGAWSFYSADGDGPIPLYFGDLYHRVQLTGDPSGSVNSFYKGANVSMTDTDAVAQGIVGDQLVNGSLVTSYDDTVKVPFFEEGAYEDQEKYMKFYNDLQFPFKALTENGVTTYSFNSKEQTVYYDYAGKIVSSDNKIYDTKGTIGYFPFNKDNPDDKSRLNYGFGTKFEIPFTVSTTGLDKNGDQIKFTFTGDDDVWVYIDDALVLDMGGAHELANGEINFATKNATVTTDSADAARGYNEYGGNLTFESNGKKTIEFKDITVKTPSGETTTLEEYIQRDSTVHTLTMYYMERGMYNSNMSISFSFVPLPSGLSLSESVNTEGVNSGLKAVVSTADSFDYTIRTQDLKKTDSSLALVEKLGYTLMDYNDNASPGQVATNSVVKDLNSVNFATDFINTDSKDDAFYAGTGFKITQDTTKDFVLDYDWSKTTWSVYDMANANKALVSNTDESASYTTTDAEFTMGDASSSSYAVYNRYVHFVNTPKVGSVSMTKAWAEGDTKQTDEKYHFKIEVDLDGNGDVYDYAPYELEYITDTSTAKTGTDGTFELEVDQTIKFPGIPVGANVKVTETVTSGTKWEVDGEPSAVCTVAENSTSALKITNKTKTVDLDKVIYIETVKDTTKDAGTEYTVKDSSDIDGENKVTVTELKTDSSSLPEGTTASKEESDNGNTITYTYKKGDEDTGITVVFDKTSGTITLKTENAGKEYVIPYAGTKDGMKVNGNITVYTYKATDKAYVFDYGLESDLTTTNDNKDGLFEGGVFYNTYAEEANATTATLSEVVDKDANNTQTTIAKADNVAINSDGSATGSVIFTPVAFMDTVEDYTYKANIVKTGATFDANDPETGTVVNGTIKVMPASIVYYEDNFNTTATGSTAKIIYSDTTVQDGTTGVVLSQSNNQSEQYGYDEEYKDDSTYSAGSATQMSANATATFTFKGTGFDIISRTNTNTASIQVKVYAGTDTTATPEKTIPLITYYDDGDLYQVPVIHVEDMEWGQYTVVIEVMSFNDSGINFYLDGIRIYDPLEEGDDAYLGSESMAEDSEIRPLILSSTAAGGEDHAVICAYGSISEGQVAVGNTYVEILNGQTGDTDSSTSDLDKYWKWGPNNELYLEKGNALAFMIPCDEYNSDSVYGEGYDDRTLQVAAKLENGTSVTLAAIDTSGNQEKIADVSSASTMYYRVPVTDDMKVTVDSEDYYQIVIANVGGSADSARVSLTNIKCTTSPESFVVPPVSKAQIARAVALAFGTEEGTVNSAKFTGTVRKGKTASIQVYTSVDVEGINICDSEGNMLTDLTWTSSIKTMNDGTTRKLWTAKFTAPDVKGKYTYKVSGQIGNKETFDIGEAVLTVK